MGASWTERARENGWPEHIIDEVAARLVDKDAPTREDARTLRGIIEEMFRLLVKLSMQNLDLTERVFALEDWKRRQSPDTSNDMVEMIDRSRQYIVDLTGRVESLEDWKHREDALHDKVFDLLAGRIR